MSANFRRGNNFTYNCKFVSKIENRKHRLGVKLGDKRLLVFAILFSFVLLFSAATVSAEKMWNFNNHTVNISNDLYVGGQLFGDGSGLTGIGGGQWNVSGSNLFPKDLGLNVQIGGSNNYGALTVTSTGERPFALRKAEAGSLQRWNIGASIVGGIYASGTTGVGLYGGGTEGDSQLFLKSDGNVGIGTSSPNAELDVSSGDDLYPTIPSNIKAIFSTDNTSLYDAAISIIAPDQSSLYFGDYDAADVGRITYSHATDSMELRTSGGAGLTISSTGVLSGDGSGLTGVTTADSWEKVFSVSNTVQLELTDNSGASLNVNKVYEVSMVTQSTGTDTGARYIVWADDTDNWNIRMVTQSGTSSNHPRLLVDTNVVKVATWHANNYPVKVFVKEYDTGTNDARPNLVGSDFQWQRTGDAMYYTDGTVGIGAISPGQRLSVTDSFSITNTGGYQYLLMGNQDSSGVNNPAMISAANGNMYFGNGNSWLSNGGTMDNTMLIDNANNRVGIGDTSPDGTLKLDVEGQVGATEYCDENGGNCVDIANVAGTDVDLTLSQYNQYYYMQFGTITIPGGVTNYGNSWVWMMYGYEVGGDQGKFGILRMNVRRNNDNTIGSYTFTISNLGTTKVDPVYAVTNDGITYNLYYKVAAKTGWSGYYKFKMLQGDNFLAAGTHIATDTAPTGSVATWTAQESVSATPWSKSGNDLYYNSGNVGIGDSSPLAKLVVKDGETWTFDSGNNPRYVLGDSSGSGDWGAMRWDSASDVLEFGTDTGGYNLHINEAGKVGIGTSTPGGALDILGGDGGASNPTLLLQPSSGANAWSSLELYGGTFDTTNDYMVGRGSSSFHNGRALTLHVPDLDSSFYGGTGENPKIVFASSGSEEMGWIESGTNNWYMAGKVGIGETSPNAKLEVNNNIAYSMSSLSTAINPAIAFRIRGRNTATSTLAIASMATNDYGIQAVNDAGTAGNNLALNPYGGNVAIGAASGSEKLLVQGQDVAFYSGTGTNNLEVGRNANENINLHVSDTTGSFTYDQDETDASPHDFTFNIDSPSSGSADWIFQNRGVETFRIGDDGVLTGDGSGLTGVTASGLGGYDASRYSRSFVGTFSSGDWDSMTTYGVYKIQHSSFSSDTNNPPASYAYGINVVTVSEIGGEGRIQQVYYPHSTSDKNIYQRMRNGGGWTSWSKIWRGGTGAGSGLDADTIDTLSSGSFLRSDTADTAAGQITFSNDAGPKINPVTNGVGATLGFSDNAGGSYAQNGWITYKHADNAIATGSNDGFIIGGSEPTTVVKVDGRLDVVNDLNVAGKITGDGSGLTGVSVAGGNNYDEYLINLESNDLTASDIATVLGMGSSEITKCDDSTAPVEGCFEVSGYHNSDLETPKYYKVNADSEYIFEVWIKVQSGTTTTQRFYAGWGMYNSAKSYFGNTQRYWGSSGTEFDANSYNDGQWHLMRGKISGIGSSTGNFISGTEYAKPVLLFNYPSGNVVTRYAGLKFYKSKDVVSSLYIKTGIGPEHSTTDGDTLVVDGSANLHAASQLNIGGSTPTISFDAAGTGDAGIRGNGENLEIFEPEDSNKVWAYFQDDTALHLTGTPNLVASGSITGTTFDSGSGAKELGDAAVTNGDTNSIPTSDQVYDFVDSFMNPGGAGDIYVEKAGDTMTGNLNFGNSGTGKRGIQGQVADNDYWFVGGAGTASNAGYMEIATGDDHSEPIYARQYSGSPTTGSLYRSATLLDGSGNTQFPGTVTASSFSGSLSGTADNSKACSGDSACEVQNYVDMAYGRALQSTDEWLRINPSNSHSSGTYVSGMLRADGGLRVSDDEGFYRSAEDVVSTLGDDLKVEGGDLYANNIHSYSGGNVIITIG